MNKKCPSEAEILDALLQVEDPEIGCNIVDLGLVYSIACDDGRVKVVMTLTTPGCPMHESICWGVRNAILSLDGVADVDVALVWEPPWNPSMMTETGNAIIRKLNQPK